MRVVWVVLCKELTDAFRDWRMVVVAFCVRPVPACLIVTSAPGRIAPLESTATPDNVDVVPP